MSNANATATTNANPFHLTSEEGEFFLRLLGASQTIKSHRDLLLWLEGDLQDFLPHQILVCASGDFTSWQINVDIVSSVPGVRTAQLAECSIDDWLERLHKAWVEAGRRPLVLNPAELRANAGNCACALRRHLREMRALVVHGVHDARSERDSLYVFLHQGSFTRGRPKVWFEQILDLVLPQLEVAFRRVKPYRFAGDRGDPLGRGASLHLSARELQILEQVCRGDTNLGIARSLEISPFTVKNHVQRIYRKIGVTNRTQAAMKYNDVFRELRSAFTVETHEVAPSSN